MLESLTLKDIIDLGTSGMLLVFLFALWQRLNVVTDILIDMGKQASAERIVLARNQGLSTQSLKRQATEVRARLEADEEL